MKITTSLMKRMMNNQMKLEARMKKQKPKACYEIKEGLFFPSDFSHMNKRTAIYIQSGKLIFLDALEYEDVVKK